MALSASYCLPCRSLLTPPCLFWELSSTILPLESWLRHQLTVTTVRTLLNPGLFNVGYPSETVKELPQHPKPQCTANSSPYFFPSCLTGFRLHGFPERAGSKAHTLVGAVLSTYEKQGLRLF